MADAKYRVAADVFDAWSADVLSGRPPVRWALGDGGLAGIGFGPGRVLLLGGAPGSGKTALAMQLLLDGLRLTPSLRVLVCNVEMPAAALLERQLARFSGVDLSDIQRRDLDGGPPDEYGGRRGRVEAGLAALRELAPGLAFVDPPFDLANVAAAADAFAADILCLDYIQRIRPPGNHADKRTLVDAAMDYLRQFADAGVGVLVVSAVGRTKDTRGRSSYDGGGLNLASFRESSELEFGCDDAFILAPDGAKDSAPGAMLLRHLKSRNGECRDVPLRFCGRLQRFDAVDPHAWSPDGPGGAAWDAGAGNVGPDLGALWDSTPAADGNGGGYHDAGF